MNTCIKSIFEPKLLRLPLGTLLPTRDIKPMDRCFGKYQMILSSISKLGLIEPLAVYPCRGRKGNYIILDGHLRLKALRELGHKEADCMIATEDDPFTYNDKVSRISAIQEHRMIMRAIDNGVGETDIAQALSVDVERIRKSINLLEGIDPQAAEKLKTKPITAAAIRDLRRAIPARQREIADLMNNTGDYARAYVQTLLLLTPPDMLVEPVKLKQSKYLKPEDIAQMEKEMETLENDLRRHQQNYGKNALSFSVIQRYVQRLLQNVTLIRFLKKNYPELHEELNAFSAVEAL